MRTTFINTLTEIARSDDRIFILTPDMGFSVFEDFAREFPGRFLNTGISEQNAMGIAAGLSFGGFKPYLYSIAPFALMRCYEQVRIGAAYMEANIKIVGSGGGVSYGSNGATHHAIEDLAIAKALPNMVVCAPADPVEARCIFKQSAAIAAPMYIRIAKNGEPIFHDPSDEITVGKAFRLLHGKDVEILAVGTITNRVREWLPEFGKQGISAGLSVFPTIKPLDTAYLDDLAAAGSNILVCEEHNVIGGFGESVCSYLSQRDAPNRVRIMGIPDKYSHYVGSRSYILEKMGLWNAPDLRALFGGRL
jgi:transketolase